MDKEKKKRVSPQKGRRKYGKRFNNKRRNL